MSSSEAMNDVGTQTPRAIRSRNKNRRADIRIGLILLLATLAVFSSVFSADFTQRDDPLTITKNPAMGGPFSEIAHFWTNLRAPTGDIYIPLTETIWYLLARLGRLPHPTSDGVPFSSLPFHVANVLLHAAGGLLAYLILRRLRINPWPAAAGALVYLLHPLQVEVVAWVSGLKDVLGGVLSLGALYSFLRFLQDDRRRLRWYLIGSVAFVMAMLAKPASVIVPVLALILGMGWLIVATGDGQITSGRPGFSANLRRIWAPLLIWVLLAVPIVVEGRRVQPASIVPDVALWMRPLVAMDALAFYLGKLIVPLNLGVDYGRTPAVAANSGAVYWTWIFPAAALLTLWFYRKKRPLIFTGLLLFIAAPLPVLGLIKFEYQYFSTVSDRYVYLGMIGAALVLAAILNRAPHRMIVMGATIMVGVVLGVLSFIQCGYWRNDRTLWMHNEEVNPNSFATELHLARTFANEADNEKAIQRYERAVQLNPQDAPHREFAELLMKQGRTMAAAEEYQAAIPKDPNDADLRNTLGVALVHLRKFPQAQAAFEDALRLNPRLVQAEVNLGNVLGTQGQDAAAAEHFHRALALDPNSADARRGLEILRSTPAAH